MHSNDDAIPPVQTDIPPPGGLPAPYTPPPDAMSAEMVGALIHDYVHTDSTVDGIAVKHGLTTREVRTAIKRYGLDKKKSDIIAQVQQEELAAYSKFLLDNRVDTAKQHLAISNKLNKAVDNILSAADGKTPAQLAADLKTLKDIAGLYRSLSETLSASAGVGARAVALSGLTAEQGAGLALSSVSGKKPLVSLSFNVSAPAPRERQAEVLEAELVDARSEP